MRIPIASRHANHEAVEDGSKPVRHSVSEWIPFDRWAKAECGDLVAEAVQDAIESRHGPVSALGITGVTADEDPTTTVLLLTTYDRDGNVVSEPNATVAEVAAVAPAWVTATVRFGGREHTCRKPIRVDETEVRYE